MQKFEKMVLFLITICFFSTVTINYWYGNKADEIIVETTVPEDEIITVEYPKELLEEKLKEDIKPVFYLSDYERWVAECIVMGESKGEPYDGQVLVAQCILNACLKDGLQPSEVRTKYQYSGWDEELSDSVKNAVKEVFDDGYKVTEEFILYFYAPKHVSSRWHETQKFVTEVGGHRFFAEWDN